mmetsp:Transcript_64761/g.189478  ORF Transcript_64761/g.189478 Transcript_64761/m.189478 type:complete len:205 (-) Transcript_64761:372-986(-)
MLDLVLRDRAQEVHPALQAAFDHDDAVLFELRYLGLSQLQLLRTAARDHSGGQRHLRGLHAGPNGEEVDRLARNRVHSCGLGLRGRRRQAPDAIARQEHADGCQDCAELRVSWERGGRVHHVLKLFDLGVLHDVVASVRVLHCHASEAEHRKAPILQLAELLLSQLLGGHVRRQRVPGPHAHAQVACQRVGVEEQAVAAVELKH